MGNIQAGLLWIGCNGVIVPFLYRDCVNPVSYIYSLDEASGDYFWEKPTASLFDMTFVGDRVQNAFLMPFSFGDENKEGGGIDHLLLLNTMF